MGFNAFLKIPHLISHVKGESNWIFNPRLITLHATLGVGGDREVLCPSLLFRGSMSETGSGEKCCAEPFYCVDGTRDNAVLSSPPSLSPPLKQLGNNGLP